MLTHRVGFLVWMIGAWAAVSGAEEIAWGDAVNGLRMGLSCEKNSVTVDKQPRFTVRLENTGDVDLNIPAPTSFVPKTHERVIGHFVRPLKPLIETAKGRDLTYSITGAEKLAEVSKDRMAIKAHETVTLTDWELKEHSYTEGRRDYGDQTSAKTNVLRSDSSYRVRFQFENENAELGGIKVWRGKSVSGSVEINVTLAPPPQGIESAFGLDETEFGLYQPIYVTFSVTNRGAATVAFPSGGDYRGTGRHDRFSFQAVDEQGFSVPDPISPSGTGGGLGGDSAVEPGKTYTEKLLLNQWCAFSKPGKYIITCRRTLNFAQSRSHVMEEMMPVLPVETKLTITIKDNDTLKKYLMELPSRFASDPNNKARDELGALAHARVEEALPIIAELLKNGALNEYKRRDAIYWLGLYGNSATDVVLKAAATDSDPRIRHEALRNLVEWKDPRAAALVLKALGATGKEERHQAIELCYRHKIEGCFETLMTMSDDKDPIVRRYLSMALAKYENRAAIPVLQKLLNDLAEDPFIAIWAAGALEKLGRKDGIPVMIGLLKEERTRSYRGNILNTLKELTGVELRDDYREWEAWWAKEHKRFERL